MLLYRTYVPEHSICMPIVLQSALTFFHLNSFLTISAHAVVTFNQFVGFWTGNFSIASSCCLTYVRVPLLLLLTLFLLLSFLFFLQTELKITESSEISPHGTMGDETMQVFCLSAPAVAAISAASAAAKIKLER